MSIKAIGVEEKQKGQVTGLVSIAVPHRYSATQANSPPRGDGVNK